MLEQPPQLNVPFDAIRPKSSEDDLKAWLKDQQLKQPCCDTLALFHKLRVLAEGRTMLSAASIVMLKVHTVITVTLRCRAVKIVL